MSARPEARTTLRWPIRRIYQAPLLSLHGRDFRWGQRTYVMGIVNATPDSFSGDGTNAVPSAAAQLARRFEAEGADIIDVGGESSRPGAEPLAPDEEARRVVPAIEAVRSACALPVSVDTYNPEVAEAALQAGAHAVNDIHGLRFDPRMADVVASAGAAIIAMHNQRDRPHTDVAADIDTGFRETLRIAHNAGIPNDRIILDPGFGFGWAPQQNLEMLRRLPELWPFGFPLLLGTSRKSTIGHVLDADVGDRLEGTAAAVAQSITAGADIVRVHDVAEMAKVARTTDAIVRAHWQMPGA